MTTAEASANRRIEHLIVRHRDLDVVAVARVTARVGPAFAAIQRAHWGDEVEALAVALRTAMTSWVRETPGGWAAWEASGRQFCVDHLARHAGAPALVSRLAHLGIEDLAVQIVTGRECGWDYDADLVDPRRLAPVPQPTEAGDTP